MLAFQGACQSPSDTSPRPLARYLDSFSDDEMQEKADGSTSSKIECGYLKWKDQGHELSNSLGRIELGRDSSLLNGARAARQNQSATVVPNDTSTTLFLDKPSANRDTLRAARIAAEQTNAGELTFKGSFYRSLGAKNPISEPSSAADSNPDDQLNQAPAKQPVQAIKVAVHQVKRKGARHDCERGSGLKKSRMASAGNFTTRHVDKEESDVMEDDDEDDNDADDNDEQLDDVIRETSPRAAKRLTVATERICRGIVQHR